MNTLVAFFCLLGLILGGLLIYAVILLELMHRLENTTPQKKNEMPEKPRLTAGRRGS
jgi:hypothetical protein